MKIVPIPPKTMFHEVCEQQPMQFALCHEVLQDSEYADMYASISDTHHVILDNGAFEMGTSDLTDNLLRAIELINPTEVVLPDRMFMADETLKMTEKFLSIHQYGALENRNLAGVAHGRNYSEFLMCATELANLGINVLMIPKDYEAWSGGRSVLVAMVQHLNLPIHLLGMEQDVLAHTKYATLDHVRSMDTVKPFTWALSNERFPAAVYEKHSNKVLSEPFYPTNIRRPHDYFNVSMTPEQRSQAINNLWQWELNAACRLQ